MGPVQFLHINCFHYVVGLIDDDELVKFMIRLLNDMIFYLIHGNIGILISVPFVEVVNKLGKMKHVVFSI